MALPQHATPGPTRATVGPHDHAVFVYDEDKQLATTLSRFVLDGVDHQDLSAFVHAFPAQREARRFVEEGVSNAPRLEEEQFLTLAHHQEAFEANGRIDYDHVGGVVRMLSDAAAAHRRSGLRIFVDASRRYLEAGREEEWFAFESWLGPRLQAGVGLVCAYRAEHLRRPEVLAKVLRTHAYRFEALPKKP